MPPAVILLVEDEAAIREVIEAVLEAEGYRVVSTVDGADALDVLRDGLRPCMIILDLMMPVMDGRAFREAQEREPRLAGIPLLVMSADAGIEFKALNIGVRDYLKKPIDLETVLAKVKSFEVGDRDARK